jgi:hypothetical protein
MTGKNPGHPGKDTCCHTASQVPKTWDARRKPRLVVPTFSSVSLAGTAMRQHAAEAGSGRVFSRVCSAIPITLAAIILTACAPAPPPVEQVKKKDAVEESWYAPTIDQLAALDRKAEAAFKAGDQDKAAALIEEGKPLQARLLEARQPTLPAMEAVADLDQLYGNMLRTNHNCGWATQFFQKNLARWKHWDPETEETTLRLKQAQAGIADCDRRMIQ